MTNRVEKYRSIANFINEKINTFHQISPQKIQITKKLEELLQKTCASRFEIGGLVSNVLINMQNYISYIGSIYFNPKYLERNYNAIEMEIHCIFKTYMARQSDVKCFDKLLFNTGVLWYRTGFMNLQKGTTSVIKMLATTSVNTVDPRTIVLAIKFGKFIQTIDCYQFVKDMNTVYNHVYETVRACLMFKHLPYRNYAMCTTIFTPKSNISGALVPTSILAEFKTEIQNLWGNNPMYFINKCNMNLETYRFFMYNCAQCNEIEKFYW
jgi:hypothetical protein